MTERRPSPMRQILAEKTERWQTAKQQNGKPIDGVAALFDLYRSHQTELFAVETFASGAIAAAGYRRDSTLPYEEAIAKNRDYLGHAAEVLDQSGLLSLQTTAEKASIGHIDHWTDVDYLVLMLGMISRPDIFGGANYFDNEIRGVIRWHEHYNPDILNGHNLTNEERRPHYLAFADDYLKVLAYRKTTPVATHVALLDAQESLSCDAETVVARALGARVCYPALIKVSADLHDSTLDPGRRTQMEHLQSLGA